MSIMKKVLAAGEGKKIKELQAIVPQVNDWEDEIKALDDLALKAKTADFKQRLENGGHTDDFLPEAFAVVREAASRALGQRHFDVQIMGGAALNKGWIAEM